VTVTGFCADTPTMPSWSPKIGTRVRGDSPLISYMYSIGASRYFLPADADSAEVAQAYSAATYGTPTPDPIRAPVVKKVMISTRPLSVGEGVVPAGSLADSGAALVVRFPDAWQPVPEGYGS
jgi:hypothetical protein